ncbi:MAG: hypothetical protein R8P61_01265 [Bacteroidia bacterium]|nr:hypothetical protein [Bacteroidia bacterium]
MSTKSKPAAYMIKRSMNLRSYLLICLLSIPLFYACEPDEVLVIDSRLKPYFDRFEEEASMRGLSLDFSDLEGKIEDLDGVGGQCVRNSTLPDEVLIDFVFWTQASELEKEFIVFHELGHCVLDRSHLDTKNADGTCVSIMHSGVSGCRFIYEDIKREEYLEELFYR